MRYTSLTSRPRVRVIYLGPSKHISQCTHRSSRLRLPVNYKLSWHVRPAAAKEADEDGQRPARVSPTVCWVEAGGKNISGMCVNSAGRGQSSTNRFEKQSSLTTHAEMMACSRIPGARKRRVAYVLRFTRDGDPAASMPCYACAKILQKCGVMKVVFFASGGGLCAARMDDILVNAVPTRAGRNGPEG